MPDTHYTDLASRTPTPATVRAARLRVATASRVAFPDDEAAAVADLRELLEHLGIGRAE